MMILAIDPGPSESAFVVLLNGSIHNKGKVPNEEMRRAVLNEAAHFDRCVIEMIASYGMAVGAEVFETCVWIGRFIEAHGAKNCDRLTRGEVKMHLCHSMRAKDANIRQAIIDRVGGKQATKKGGKLYGISGDVWAALAVALTWYDLHAAKTEGVA